GERLLQVRLGAGQAAGGAGAGAGAGHHHRPLAVEAPHTPLLRHHHRRAGPPRLHQEHADRHLQADAAVLMLSAAPGEFEAGVCRQGQTREHALLAYTLGLKQLLLCVNKMDLTEPPSSQRLFEEVVRGVSLCLGRIGYSPAAVPCLPVSGWAGENVTLPSPS
ncbi:unnamed protein product, partial [Eretmochelys imbricata]